MRVNKEMKLKSKTPLSVHKKRQTKSKLAVKTIQSKSASGQKSAPQKKRSRENVDAWDSGVVERKHQEAANKLNRTKRLKFNPAPPTFQLPTREETLRKQLGDFAGPLLGTLWEEQAEDDRKSNVTFVDNNKVKKSSSLMQDDSLNRSNQFTALASSDDEEEEGKSDQANSRPKIVFKPSTLMDANLSKSTTAWMFQSSSSSSSSATAAMFKPASFNAEDLKQQPSSTSTFAFRPATFHAPQLTIAHSELLPPSSSKMPTSSDNDWDDL